MMLDVQHLLVVVNGFRSPKAPLDTGSSHGSTPPVGRTLHFAR